LIYRGREGERAWCCAVERRRGRAYRDAAGGVRLLDFFLAVDVPGAATAYSLIRLCHSAITSDTCEAPMIVATTNKQAGLSLSPTLIFFFLFFFFSGLSPPSRILNDYRGRVGKQYGRSSRSSLTSMILSSDLKIHRGGWR
jgi:hypothetical protein